MDRLWVRFSVIIGSFTLAIILLVVGSIIVLNRAEFIVFVDNAATEKPEKGDVDSPLDFVDDISFNGGFQLHDVPEGLAALTVLVGVVGVTLGVWLSRGLSTPIVTLSEAAKQIGSGNLKQRVPVHQHSHELDELARSFNRMAADLEHGEEARNNMLADISHELRTPLTVLSGQLRAALDKVVPLDEEELANLYGQTQHLIHLVDDLRLLAQAEAHQLKLTISSVSLAELWQELEANFSLVAAEKGIRFQVESMDGLPHLSADHGRLRQVFSNLLANAIRHTSAGGKITVSSAVKDGTVYLIIQDSGEGIAPEQLPHLFDRFYRVDTSRARDTGGSGLGLAIVRALVEMHHGEVSAESAGINKGSTFTVRLPM